MQLKTFQQDALDALAAFLAHARTTDGPAAAYAKTVRALDPGRTPAPYRTLPGLPGVPNACIRLPTGGGKTILAAHSIAAAGRTYMER